MPLVGHAIESYGNFNYDCNSNNKIDKSHKTP